ncbi:type VII secretion protein EssA [Virgibacillus sp. MSJ-26]|uniref:type VII secretion protein EssA n=1 Tax=Virgibacillus sp. MSJ-26 TaxID=2841522 RepID=UPI001C11974F|nr:type VII secretion protein EssA [Virgibacillus sp. MSJ-26]MBU5465953.1 type VII secretion protein EssA [Virgibacillus sp. MSJ-26]
MKKKLLSFFILLGLNICLSPVSLADEESEDVEPNVYEKREINIQKNFRDNLIERRKLPEEQKELTFEKPIETESEQIMDELFQSNVIETNTITSKAAQMDLFSMSDQESKRDMEEELVPEGSNLLMILMIAGVISIIAMLFVIIPKLQHTRD